MPATRARPTCGFARPREVSAIAAQVVPGPAAPSRSALRDLPWLAGMALRAAPGPVAAWAALVLVGAFMEAGELFTMRGAVNALVGVRGHALPWLVAMGAVYAAGAALGRLRPYVGARVRWRAGGALQARVLDRLAGLPVEAFDAQRTFDLTRRVAEGADSRGPDLIGEAFRVAEAVPAMLANAAALALAAVWLPAVVVATMLLLLWQRARFGASERELDVRWTRTRRLAGYYAEVLTSRAHGAEVRLWGLRDILIERWRQAFGGYVAATLHLDAANNLRGLPGMVGMPAVCGIALASIGVFGGRVQAGNAALVLTALRSLFILISHYGRSVQAFVGHAGYASDLRALLALAPEAGAASPPTSVPAVPTHPLRSGITLSHVSYGYPGAEALALCDIDVHIRAGQVVALVGANGAGKTTLAHVLLGLRRPTGGVVLYDGVDLATVPAAEVRRRCTAVFQQPLRYPDTLGRNVSPSGEAAAAHEALARVGLANAAAVPQGATIAQGDPLDPLLGPEFGGVDLSGGQWQRVAIARALARAGADVAVFDEPTAALDPLAEVALFERFAELAAGRTTVLVSHRLGPTRLADRVLVLEGGRLVEDGPPDRLLASDGPFARMFAAQAAWYR